jgi:hypothetical protein
MKKLTALVLAFCGLIAVVAVGAVIVAGTVVTSAAMALGLVLRHRSDRMLMSAGNRVITPTYVRAGAKSDGPPNEEGEE